MAELVLSPGLRDTPVRYLATRTHSFTISPDGLTVTSLLHRGDQEKAQHSLWYCAEDFYYFWILNLMLEYLVLWGMQMSQLWTRSWFRQIFPAELQCGGDKMFVAVSRSEGHTHEVNITTFPSLFILSEKGALACHRRLTFILSPLCPKVGQIYGTCGEVFP